MCALYLPILVAFATCSSVYCDIAKYLVERNEILNVEYDITLGGSVLLTQKEEQADVVASKLNDLEWDIAFQNPGYAPQFQPPEKFVKSVKYSNVYNNIVTIMPKGALLHTHEVGMSSADYILSLTTRDRLYFCGGYGRTPLKFKFLKDPKKDTTCPWKEVKQERKEHGAIFDQIVQEQLTLLGRNFADEIEVANGLRDVQLLVKGLIGCKSIFEEYVYQTITELYLDGVYYVEVRSPLDQLYDEDGKSYDYHTIIQVYQDAVKKFQKTNPDFFGIKIIYTVPRSQSGAVLKKSIDTYVKIKAEYPNIIVGFDFDGNENLNIPLKDQAAQLLPPLQSKLIDYVFHIGITLAYGAHSDENLVDGLLLKSKRLGLAFALTNHPLLLQMVTQENVAIELTPLGSLVTKHVWDIRTHPGGMFGALGVNLVIGNGNPGLWGNSGVSKDFHLALMGFSSKRDTLGYLKKLVLNSIEYSLLSCKEKTDLTTIWQKNWDKFLTKLINDNKLKSAVESMNGKTEKNDKKNDQEDKNAPSDNNDDGKGKEVKE